VSAASRAAASPPLSLTAPPPTAPPPRPRLIDELTRVCRERGCYKVILDCADHNVAFYEKCGLTRKEIQMVRRGRGEDWGLWPRTGL
jgi:hypothetical protein